MSFKLFTVFPMELLRWFAERDDEPRTAAEADVFGPWQVVPLPAGTHGLFRWGEGPDNHLPALTFKKREDALLAAAASVAALPREQSLCLSVPQLGSASRSPHAAP
jgi:hypothetical protein